ncbi:MAG TPA: S8 family serine peptidase [Gaiellales bacterium]|nr:S8 family serine peptidase [Gaiellales bacterium]
MKRFGVIAVVVAAVFAISSGASSASTTGTALGYRHACAHGQMRCFALIETANGSNLDPMTAGATAAPGPAAYGPKDYHTAYHLPRKTPLRTDGTHKAVTVAIVDAFDDATIYHDLKVYSKKKGIPVLPQCTKKIVKACFHKRNLGAKPGSAVRPGWDVEIALDVETVHAICENCRVDLFEAPNARTASLGAAENVAANHANIISNSFGSYGNDGKGTSSQNTPFSHPHKAIVVAAGDFGYGVAFPASLNSVISVGGTRLLLGANHTYKTETAWGPQSGVDPHAGSGSGCADGSFSGLRPVKAQAFQANVANYANTGCGSFRGDNDVSANGDPFSGSAVFASSTGWIKVGGTSLSTPLIAGTYALAANAASVPYPASMLYADANTTAFNDVISGNDNAGNWVKIGGAPCNTSTTACKAAPGYDLPTGVGTPHGLAGF